LRIKEQEIRLTLQEHDDDDDDDDERFNLRNLNELEVRKQYQTEIKNRFAVLEDLSDSEDISRVWENIKGN